MALTQRMYRGHEEGKLLAVERTTLTVTMRVRVVHAHFCVTRYVGNLKKNDHIGKGGGGCGAEEVYQAAAP